MELSRLMKTSFSILILSILVNFKASACGMGRLNGMQFRSENVWQKIQDEFTSTIPEGYAKIANESFKEAYIDRLGFAFQKGSQEPHGVLFKSWISVIGTGVSYRRILMLNSKGDLVFSVMYNSISGRYAVVDDCGNTLGEIKAADPDGDRFEPIRITYSDKEFEVDYSKIEENEQWYKRALSISYVATIFLRSTTAETQMASCTVSAKKPKYSKLKYVLEKCDIDESSERVSPELSLAVLMWIESRLN